MANRPDPRKEQFWRRMLKLWKRSGLSVRAFCQQHDLAEPSFYSWRAVLAQRDQSIPQPSNTTVPTADTNAAEPTLPLFLPLRLAAPAVPLEVILPDGTLVRVPANFDPDALQRLLTVLRGAPC